MCTILKIHQEGPVDTAPEESEMRTYLQWMQLGLGVVAETDK